MIFYYSRSMSNDHKLQDLKQLLSDMKRVIIAYSGGIDSTFLLFVAHEVLGENAIGVTLVSPSIPDSEVNLAREIANHIGAPHIVLQSNETDDPIYQENTPDRCYFCRKITYSMISDYAQRNKCEIVIDGSNADDFDDHRPGRRAAIELGIKSPLQEVGFSKSEIRQLAHQNGLPNWDKPSAACLSSRVPYGSPITPKILLQIGQAENKLKSLGFTQIRVRHYDLTAKIEVPQTQFQDILYYREEISSYFKCIGYKYVSLDLDGFRSGSLNEVL